MKKFISFILIAAIVVAGAYFLNAYTGDPVGNYISMQNKSLSTTLAGTKSKNSEKKLEFLMENTLDAEEKNAYETIYSGLLKLDKSINVGSSISSQRAFYLIRLVMCDHPELFWVTGNCSYSAGRITPQYYYSKEEAEARSEKIYKTANDIYKKINPPEDDYNKSLAIYNYIVDNTSYDYNAVNDLDKNHTATTIEGVFLEGKAVCSGYAKAYQYLLMLGSISSTYITGSADTPAGNGSHAWTLQKNDGKLYYTDITWADSYENSVENGFVNHTFFCITEQEILKTHMPDDDLPHFECTATDDNYFVRQSLLFDTYEQNKIRTAVKNYYEDCTGIELKFESRDEYNKAKTDLIDDGNIYIILKSVDPFSKIINSSRISYDFDDIHNVLILIFEKK